MMEKREKQGAIMLKTGFKNWLLKHAHKDFTKIVMSSVGAASVPYFLDQRKVIDIPFHPLAPMLPIIGGTYLDRTRNTAVMAGVHTGIHKAMKRLRGEENVQTNLVAGFGTGVAISLVLGINGIHAISNGVLGALVGVGSFKVRGSKPQLYKKTKDMLSSLDLDRYTKNFKKGHLTDKTLPMLNDSDLKEVNLPVGARRLILDHIQREMEAEKGGTRREI